MLQSLTGKWWEKCKWGWTLEKTFWTGVVAKGEVLSITKKKLTRNPPIRLHKYIHIYIHIHLFLMIDDPSRFPGCHS